MTYVQHCDTTDTLAYLTGKIQGLERDVLEKEAESIAASLGRGFDEVHSMYIHSCV